MTKNYNPLEHSVVQSLMKADGYQAFECPHYVEALVQEIRSELERAYWNVKQTQFDESDWQFLEIPRLEFRRYFWGECDCGAESPVHSESCRQVLERNEWVRRRMEACCDPPNEPYYEDGFPSPSTLRFDKFEEWEKENPHPPCTCGAEDSWSERDYHLDSCSPQLPNLSFGDVRISWYKRIGRGMSVNVDWTEPQWVAWFDSVCSSIRKWEKKNCRVKV